MQSQVIGYVRVSTAEQADLDISMESQAQRIRAWNDFHQRGELRFVEEFGVSAKSLKTRPKLVQALSILERGDTLVVDSLSRLVESIRDAMAIVTTLEKKGANLVSLTEELNTGSAAGRIVFHLLASLAELERGQIGERTSTCLRHLFLSGGYIGGGRPFGFDLVTIAGKTRLKLNKKEWLVIEIARRLRKEGLSFRKIAMTLNQWGYGRRSGGAFFPMQVARMMEPKPSASSLWEPDRRLPTPTRVILTGARQ